MDLEVHHVKKITLRDIGGSGNRPCSCNWREIVVETEKGEKLVVSLFSDNKQNLILKKEKRYE